MTDLNTASRLGGKTGKHRREMMSDTLWQALRDAYIKGAQDVHDCTKLIDWKAEAEPIAAEYRNQIFQEMIEKAEAECRQDPETGIRGERKPGEDPVKYGVRLKHAEGAAKWLKSQMEGGE